MNDDPRHRDYLPEPPYPGFVDPEAPTSEPEPGTGTVWVIPPEEDEANLWGAVWRAADKHVGIFGTTREEVVAWALIQPATQWLTRLHVGEPWADLTRASRPSPGTGTVWVSPSTGDSAWVAVWVAKDVNKHAIVHGSQKEAVSWGLAQPALGWLIRHEDEYEWVELKPTTQGGVS